MKFFVDTADIEEIRSLAATGMVDGVTTNPSLVAKSGRNFLETIREICAITDGPVSAEVAATEGGAAVADRGHRIVGWQLRPLQNRLRLEVQRDGCLRNPLLRNLSEEALLHFCPERSRLFFVMPEL